MSKEISICLVTESIDNEDSIGVVPETTFPQSEGSSILVWVEDGKLSLWLSLAFFLSSASIVSIVMVVELVVLRILSPGSINTTLVVCHVDNHVEWRCVVTILCVHPV